MAGKPDLDERFWSKVDFESSSNGCWLWKPFKNKSGYAYFYHSGTNRIAHRLAYANIYGPIPQGLEIDHLCRVRHCVNPSHLEAVTPRVNNLRSTSPAAIHARKTECLRGHSLLDPSNVTRNSRSQPNSRACRTCNRIRHAETRARKRAAA